jgi:hypothetical protein
MRTELASAVVTGSAGDVALAAQAAEDLRAAGKITGELSFVEGPSSDLTVEAVIAGAPAAG